MGRILNALRALSGKPEPNPRRGRRVRRLHPKAEFCRSFDMGVVDNIFPSSSGQGASINADLYQANATMRKRARYEANNTPHAKRALREFRRNVVGKAGIRLRPDFRKRRGKPDTFENRNALKAWQEWGKSGTCDVTGQLSWRQVQELAVTSLLRDGEIFIRLIRGWKGNRFGFAVQLIEADRVGDQDVRTTREGNEVLMGVEVNGWMRPVAYHVATNKSAVSTLWASSPASRDSTLRVPASDMIHLYIPERVEQLRGFTFMSAAFRTMHLGKGLEEAEVVAARASANKIGLIVTPDGTSFVGDDEDDDGTILVDSDPGGLDQVPAGTKIEPWDPQHPNGKVPEFLEHLSHTVGSALDTGNHRLTGNLKGASFSSMKHGHANDSDVYGELQGFMSEKLCFPVYSEWMNEAILFEAVPFKMFEREKYDSVKWTGPNLASVDPQKEANANKQEVALGTKTVTEIVESRGRSLEEVVDERAAEIAYANSKGVSLEAGALTPTVLIGKDDAGIDAAALEAIANIVEKATAGLISVQAATVLLVEIGLDEQKAGDLLAGIEPDDDPDPSAEA